MKLLILVRRLLMIAGKELCPTALSRTRLVSYASICEECVSDNNDSQDATKTKLLSKVLT